MGIWAGIKHALNSTLGTENFKPLDEMILSQTRMVASADSYCSLGSAEVIADAGTTEVIEHSKKLKMIRPGEAYLAGTLNRQSLNSTNGRFRIYKNGEQIYEWNRRWGQGEATESFSVKISFVPYDVFSFELMVYSASDTATRYLRLSDFVMNGTIIQNVFIETM